MVEEEEKGKKGKSWLNLGPREGMDEARHRIETILRSGTASMCLVPR